MTPRQNVPNQQKKAETAHKFVTKLSSSQRAKLRGMAHSLKPVVQVGGQGLSPATLTEIAKALQHHELIKIQLPGQSDSKTKDSLSDELLQGLPVHSHFVGRIGRIVVLFLEKSPEETPKIILKDL